MPWLQSLGRMLPPRMQRQRPFLDRAVRRHGDSTWRSRLLPASRIVRLIWLIEQEVRGQLLVLIAGEVGLDDHVALEAETAQLLQRQHIISPKAQRHAKSTLTLSIASRSSSVTLICCAPGGNCTSSSTSYASNCMNCSGFCVMMAASCGLPCATCCKMGSSICGCCCTTCRSC